MMKKTVAFLLSICLCATLLIGSVGAAVSMQSEAEPKVVNISSAAPEEKQTPAKNETVYVLAGADGAVKKIIVSDWIKNTLRAAKVEDTAALQNVQNVKGDEGYVMNGDTMRVWDADGKDIYYQGSMDKELPVDLAVRYTLDGKSVSPVELAGKSGRVTIRFDYTNKQFKTVVIDGKQEKIYVPFAMLTGMILDNDIFTNVKVSNGRLLNDGDRTVVAGVAFPGLQNNLKLGKEKLEIPDYVEIAADVRKFEMMSTVTVATNSLFNSIDTAKLNDIDNLTGAADQLNSAMQQLMDGSSQLYGGLCTLLDKSGELIAGMDKLAEGAKVLQEGAGKVDGGTAKLQDGAAQLSGGLDILTQNSAALNGGVQQMFSAVLSGLPAQLAAKGITVEALTPENYQAVLTQLLNRPNEKQQAELLAIAGATVEEMLKAQNMPEAYWPAVKYLLACKVLDEKLSVELAAAALLQVMNTPQGQQALVMAAQAAATPQGQQKINTLLLRMAQQTLQPEIEQVLSQLNGCKQVCDGLETYTSGVADAAAGATELKNGTKELKDGTEALFTGVTELYNGALQLKNGTLVLKNGVTKLRDGALHLSDGLKQLNEQGIQKLSDAVNGDLGGLVARVRATVDVSKDYTAFSGKAEGMDGKVKFIYRTDAIKAEKK